MHEPFTPDELKVTVIGGGTGSFSMLSGLKNHTTRIASIVSMADDGGSTGVLRDELGALPPGDVRQCLVALSNSEKLRGLFNYRFEEGTFGGHSFGNILLTALEKSTGSFAEAVDTASEILGINGKVIPATLDSVRLKMSWPDKSIELHGERVIDADLFTYDPRQAELTLDPTPKVNDLAIAAIEQADIVLVAPGDLYTSLGPLLVIEGVGDALRRSKATTFYVCNLVTKHGQTDGFTVQDHASEIERFAGGAFLDYVLYNNAEPTPEIAHLYEEEEAFPVRLGTETDLTYRLIGDAFTGHPSRVAQGGAAPMQVTHGFIRHDPEYVIERLLQIYDDQKDA